MHLSLLKWENVRKLRLTYFYALLLAFLKQNSYEGLMTHASTDRNEIPLRMLFCGLTDRWQQVNDVLIIASSHRSDETYPLNNFNRVIPFDMNIALDTMLGHGNSSRLPPGAFLHYQDAMMIVHRVVKHMGWEKIVYMGHSLGCLVGYSYCSTFNDFVTQFIAIDALKPLVFKPEDAVQINRKNIEKFLSFEKMGTPHAYTYDEAIDKFLSGFIYKHHLSRESVKVLLRRGLVKSEEDDTKFHFSRDPRGKIGHIDLGTSNRNLIKYAENMRCEVLKIQAKNSVVYEPPELSSAAFENLKKHCPKVELVEVEGTHYVHLNTPENIVHIINDFIHGTI
ncbi:unnamed protein product, partial [Meganyctiphanes norvegica]